MVSVLWLWVRLGADFAPKWGDLEVLTVSSDLRTVSSVKDDAEGVTRRVEVDLGGVSIAWVVEGASSMAELSAVCCLAVVSKYFVDRPRLEDEEND